MMNLFRKGGIDDLFDFYLDRGVLQLGRVQYGGMAADPSFLQADDAAGLPAGIPAYFSYRATGETGQSQIIVNTQRVVAYADYVSYCQAQDPPIVPKRSIMVITWRTWCGAG